MNTDPKTLCSYCHYYAAQDGLIMPPESLDPTDAHLQSHPITGERITAVIVEDVNA